MRYCSKTGDTAEILAATTMLTTLLTSVTITTTTILVMPTAPTTIRIPQSYWVTLAILLIATTPNGRAIPILIMLTALRLTAVSPSVTRTCA